MEYPVEYHSALITLSSVLIGAAGIILAIVLSNNNTIFQQIIGWFIVMLSISIVAGIISMIFTLDWFIGVGNVDNWIAGIALIIQFTFILIPLATLVQPYLTKKK